MPAVEQQLLERDEFLLEIKEMLLHAHVMMKGNYDKHHRKVVSRWATGCGCAFTTAWQPH
jgi:hypothetical protein